MNFIMNVFLRSDFSLVFFFLIKSCMCYIQAVASLYMLVTAKCTVLDLREAFSSQYSSCPYASLA